jgi:hypothetical protein
MSAINEVVVSVDLPTTPTLRDPEPSPKNLHVHTLNEIQRRAYEIHQRHGAIYGGYTLEDWLEAEHELDEEDNSQARKSDQIH